MSATLDAATLALQVAQRYGTTPRGQAHIVQEVSEMAVYTLEAGSHIRPILYVAESPAGGYILTVHMGPRAARKEYEKDRRRTGPSEYYPVQFIDIMRGDAYDPAQFEGVN